MDPVEILCNISFYASNFMPEKNGRPRQEQRKLTNPKGSPILSPGGAGCGEDPRILGCVTW